MKKERFYRKTADNRYSVKNIQPTKNSRLPRCRKRSAFKPIELNKKADLIAGQNEKKGDTISINDSKEIHPEK